MANFAHIPGRPSTQNRPGSPWHLGHVIGLLLSENPPSGSYTIEYVRPDGHYQSFVYFSRRNGTKWRVEPHDRDAPEISDGVTRYHLSGTTVVEHGSADANLPFEVHPAFPRYAFIWGRIPGDEWRFVEGVHQSGDTVTASLERIRTPDRTASITVDIEHGLMLAMETATYSFRVRDVTIRSVSPDLFLPPQET